MAQAGAIQRYDDALTNFFVEELCGKADKVYRFAYALTLNQQAARSAVAAVYREVADDLPAVARGGDYERLLFAKTWQTLQRAKPQSADTGDAPVTRALSNLSLDARAALVLVDVLGLAPAQAQSVFGWPEAELRTRLAKARKALLASSFGQVVKRAGEETYSE